MLLHIWSPVSGQFSNGYDVLCGEQKIEISLEKNYLSSKNVHITDKAQLHMSENQTSCEPIEDGNFYKFIIFAPFDSCFTRVAHDTEDYVYSNEIFYNNGRNKVMVFKWRCIYEDKYLVSVEHGIKPVERTLSFVTEQGKFDVDMKVYNDESFSSASMVNERTPIKLNAPVYVSMDLFRPFDKPEIVLSVKNCFATDQAQPSVETENWYSLISGMCVTEDESVVMLENGIGTNARFKFNMFKWRTKTSYIYMHCEVHLCDSSDENEQCSNDDRICTGADRVRRSAPELSAPEEGEILTELKPTIMSRGPILIDEVKIVGKGEIDALELNLYNNEFLRIYIVITICVVLAFVGILVGIIAVVIRRRNERAKELFVQ